jgi:DNA-binding transcriptional regulator of glucitol operon
MAVRRDASGHTSDDGDPQTGRHSGRSSVYVTRQYVPDLVRQVQALLVMLGRTALPKDSQTPTFLGDNRAVEQGETLPEDNNDA